MGEIALFGVEMAISSKRVSTKGTGVIAFKLTGEKTFVLNDAGGGGVVWMSPEVVDDFSVVSDLSLLDVSKSSSCNFGDLIVSPQLLLAADDEISIVEDFDEKSILSLVLKLPPIPDSGDGRKSRLDVSSLQPSSLSFNNNLLLPLLLLLSFLFDLSAIFSSGISDELLVEVIISHSISCDREPVT